MNTSNKKSLSTKQMFLRCDIVLLLCLHGFALTQVFANLDNKNIITYCVLTLIVVIFQVLHIWIKWEHTRWKYLHHFCAILLALFNWGMLPSGIGILPGILYVLLYLAERSTPIPAKTKTGNSSVNPRIQKLNKLMPKHLPRGMYEYDRKNIYAIFQPIFPIPFLGIPIPWQKIYLVHDGKSYRVYDVKFNVSADPYFGATFSIPDLKNKLLQWLNISRFVIKTCPDDSEKPFCCYVSNDDRFIILSAFDNFTANACEDNKITRSILHSESEHFVKSIIRWIFGGPKKKSQK